MTARWRDLTEEELASLSSVLGISVDSYDDRRLLIEGAVASGTSPGLRVLLASTEAAAMAEAFADARTVVALGVEVARFTRVSLRLTPTGAVLPIIAKENVLCVSLRMLSALSRSALAALAAIGSSSAVGVAAAGGSGGDDDIDDIDDDDNERIKLSKGKTAAAYSPSPESSEPIEVLVLKSSIARSVLDALKGVFGSRETVEVLLTATHDDDDLAGSEPLSTTQLDLPEASSALPGGVKRRLSKAERKSLKKTKVEDSEEPSQPQIPTEAAASQVAAAAPPAVVMPFVLVIGLTKSNEEGIFVRSPSAAYLRSIVEMAGADRRAFW
jgi:hypothetical protein